MDERRSRDRTQPVQTEPPSATAAIAVKIHYGKPGDGYGAMVYRSVKEVGGRERGDTIAHFFETSQETFAEACQRAESFAASLSGDATAFAKPRNAQEQFADVLAKMPMEALGYVLVACVNVAMQYSGNDGFEPPSRDAFAAMQKAAEAIMRGAQ